MWDIFSNDATKVRGHPLGARVGNSPLIGRSVRQQHIWAKQKRCFTISLPWQSIIVVWNPQMQLSNTLVVRLEDSSPLAESQRKERHAELEKSTRHRIISTLDKKDKPKQMTPAFPDDLPCSEAESRCAQSRPSLFARITAFHPRQNHKSEVIAITKIRKKSSTAQKPLNNAFQWEFERKHWKVTHLSKRTN